MSTGSGWCRRPWTTPTPRGTSATNILGSGFSPRFYLHRGAGAYICGEESSLMNSLEGERGYPRVKPPFPAQFGLWGCPTTINNVETIANVPLILRMGAEAYAKIGAPKHPGPILVGVSGHVNKPGVYEMPTGVLLTDIIHKYAGGVPGNKRIKAVIPGGLLHDDPPRREHRGRPDGCREPEGRRLVGRHRRDSS